MFNTYRGLDSVPVKHTVSVLRADMAEINLRIHLYISRNDCGTWCFLNEQILICESPLPSPDEFKPVVAWQRCQQKKSRHHLLNYWNIISAPQYYLKLLHNLFSASIQCSPPAPNQKKKSQIVANNWINNYRATVSTAALTLSAQYFLFF